MIFATTPDSAARRSVVVTEPLFEMLSEDNERALRFRLSYRSGVSGGIMDYDKTGGLSVFEAIDLGDMVAERTGEDFESYLKGINTAFWGSK